ncbi:MAG: DUF4388 domain-containing protein [Planctomycetes bacterium]|nr:DUF4388 domain-containing protein [Planctomycetota bacterium]MCB9884606.1 DUF4388 domain-containing protein [Planctomycetota bacterium]
MQTAHFPASAASTLIEGYCEDFASLASILAQTLEQVSMRGLSLGKSAERLESIEQGMRDLADAIHDLLQKQQITKPPVDPKKVALEKALQPSKEPLPQPVSPAPNGPSGGGAKAPPAPAETAVKRAGDATLRGTTQSMPLLSVLQFIGRTRKSGVLRIDLGRGHIAFRFSEGSICATETTHCPEGERLGDVLVDLGFCKRADIDTLMRGASDEPGKRFGDLILSTGLVSTGQVVEALETQVQRRFQRACKAKDASYEFVPGPKASGDGRIMISSFELAYEVSRNTRKA